MDPRWEPVAENSKRDVKVILHPTASINEVRKGIAEDAYDVTELVSQASHGMFECNVTLNWNYELFGEDQPKPNWILEVQLSQSDVFLPLWIGIIDQVSNFTLSRGERSLQLIARSRDSLNIWRETKRVTDLFPQMTDVSYIARRIALAVGLEEEEILLPQSSFMTAHTNTQLADMSAWEMLEVIFLPLGWTPFIDGLGRLRGASRDLNSPWVVEIDDWQIVKTTANRARPQTTRVKLSWLNPTLSKARQQGRKLTEEVMTTGWFLPFIKKTVWFSDDKTQRAEKTYMKIEQSANNLWVKVCSEKYEQLEQNKGKITLINWAWGPTIAIIVTNWYAAHNVPDYVPVAPGPTVPNGRRVEGALQFALMMIMLSIGTGIYEIWGTPYEWVHAKNVTEAFDQSVPRWIDNPEDIESDFIVSEQHAQAVAVRELIYRAKSANKWNVKIVDHPGLEFGDILEFSDGSKLYVEDFSRDLQRGSTAELDVRGFLIGTQASAGTPTTIVDSPVAPSPVPDPPPSDGGGDGGDDGGGGNLEPQAPNMRYILEQVLASQSWRLAEQYEDEPDGRGRFTEVAVDAMHAVDPRWGHIRKNPGQNQYNGHSVDAVNWKNPDGVTAEIYDIVSGSGNIAWGYDDRTEKALELWYYPA